MEIRNRMEDEVHALVNDIFDTEDRRKELGFCTCHQCRLDVSCYVLNRIPPEYVISGRGIAHTEGDTTDKRQRSADLITLIRSGWQKIETAKRPHIHHSGRESQDLPPPPVYNFPTIIGRVFDGSNFDPITGTQVTLLMDGKPVRMIDPNWQNPCSLVSNTAGTFIFWPYPESADKVGESKVFHFELTCPLPGFTDLRHYFDLKLDSEPVAINQFTEQRTFKVQDLYLFQK